MSSNLHWRTPNPQGKSFGHALKFSLRGHLSYGGAPISEWTAVGEDSVMFLRGVIAGAGSESDEGREAQRLIELIGKHGSVEVREVS